MAEFVCFFSITQGPLFSKSLSTLCLIPTKSVVLGRKAHWPNIIFIYDPSFCLAIFPCFATDGIQPHHVSYPPANQIGLY